jgi:trafficking protein particle complex subunit 10
MDVEDVSQSVGHTENHSSRAKMVLCFPGPDSFEATVSVSRIIHMDKPRNVEVVCSSGWNDIKTAELKLRSASSGLRLRTADASLLEGEVQLETNSAPGIIKISRFKPHSSIKISIPYVLEDNHHGIVLRLDVTSSSPELAFSTIQTIPIELPLDVTVHDLFKSDQIFSRFHIGSRNGVPLNLLDVKLEGTSAYSVEAPPCSLTPTLVLDEQPATFMYKVRQVHQKGDSKSNWQASAEEKPLILSVDYQCVDEQIASKIFASFNGDLGQSDFVPLGRLLTKTLKERLQLVLLPSDHIEAVMTNEINIPSFDKLGWSAILSGLPDAVSNNLETWLRTWHNDNQSLELFTTGAEALPHQATELPPRRVLITVPLPRLQILQIATLVPSLGPSSIATVGVPITATLTLRHTRRWDSPASLKTTVSRSSPTALEFMYEIDAPPDTWLIGGQRRARFTAAEDEAKSWVIVLIPLRTGRLLLPSVDVKALNDGGSGGGGYEDDVACETDYVGFSTAVLVVGNVGRTTVAMKEGLMGPEVELVGADGI